MGEWTKGPWHLSEETTRDALRSRLVHGLPEGMLAIVRVEHQGGYYGDANANLIAAAPDLAEALARFYRLSLVIESAVRRVESSKRDAVVEVIHAARAALKKAKGEA